MDKIKTIDEMLEEVKKECPQDYQDIMTEVAIRKTKFERGGKREGAGRKRTKSLCLTFTVRLDAEEKELINIIRKNQIKVNDLINKLS